MSLVSNVCKVCASTIDRNRLFPTADPFSLSIYVDGIGFTI